MTQDRVMLLIDADNVSIDVMEQAVRLLLNQHGALHVRRAYCTAESAVKHQAAFKHLGIKPMVNLAAGKNSTDIAMAVDAVDLVLAERPDVVVIASSDSDFAPLVHRLREKGCVVRGIGQHGKTGDETQEVYDDFTVLEHRKAAGATAGEKPARKTPVRKAAAAKTAAAAKKAPAARKAAVKTASAKAPARRAAARKSAAGARQEPAGADALTLPPRTPASSPPSPSVAAASGPVAAAIASPPARGDRRGGGMASEARAGGGPAARPGGTSVDAVLACLPELARGQGLALNVAVQRLREAQLLGKHSSSLKLFAQWADRFDLLPAGKPTQVRLRD